MLWVVELLSHQPHLKIKIQSKDYSDFDSVSDEECHEDTPALGPMHLGLPPWTRRLPTLAKSPLQAALQAACSQGGFTLCLRDWTLTTCRSFMKIFHLTQAVQMLC
jgi:hypothetical protein